MNQHYDVHVVRVNLKRLAMGTTAVNVEGSDITTHYCDDDADDMAVCAAMRFVGEGVAREEIEAGDGFTVKVEFVRSAP